MPTPRTAAPLMLAGLLLGGAAAAESPRYNQVSLSAEVSREVAHDRMEVILYSERQDTDPARLATAITTTLNQAISALRQQPNIDISLGNRSSYPVYDDSQRIKAWREQAELRLHSTHFSELSQATARLLGPLKIQSMQFSLADSTRQQTEDQLLREAVAAFRSRAKLLTEALGGHDYQVVSLAIGGGDLPAPMPLYNAKAASMAAPPAPAAEIEAGRSEVQMRAEGIIEVRMP